MKPSLASVLAILIGAGVSGTAAGQDRSVFLGAAGASAAVEDEVLADLRGGEGMSILNEGALLLTNQSLDQQNSSSLTIGNLRNGDVSIADSAFSNAGMGNYVFTTGSSNNVAAALSINLIVPSP